MNLKKIGKVSTSKFVETGSSSYKKKNLLGHGLLKVEKRCFTLFAARMTSVCVVTNMLVKLSQPTPVRYMPTAVQSYGFDQTFKTRSVS
jgi:hypothetical protein